MDQASSAAGALVTGEGPGMFVVVGARNGEGHPLRGLLRLCMESGDAQAQPGYSPARGAVLFWTGVARRPPDNIPASGEIVVDHDDGRRFVTLRADGTPAFGAGYEPDAVSLEFWRMVAATNPYR